jgi:Lon protease-like protein
MEPYRLPLFPLPLVLFPGTLIPLHIFEPRYRQMVADIMRGPGRFGLLRHDPDEDGPFLNEPGRIGTVAEVRRHQPLRDGRSMILVFGVERFRTREEVAAGAPYYEALVEGYTDHPPADAHALVVQRSRSLALFQNVLHTLPHVPSALPSFSLREELSFRLAAVVRMDAFWQQELLEMQDEAERLSRLDPVFQAGIERWWEEGGPKA